MEHAVSQATGWIVAPSHAWIFIAVWIAVVVIYGAWRSRGEAKTDVIRESGPTD